MVKKRVSTLFSSMCFYTKIAFNTCFMSLTPFNLIQKELETMIPKEEVNLLPKKWEKLGDILVIKLPASLESFSDKIGEVYANILACDAVLVDTGGIIGRFREPEIKHIFGRKNTETMHHENGISFHLDPQKIMYSSGNMKERKRISTISNPSETIVDLFAGIGYFTIPIAVYSKPKKIFACEINPAAFRFLKKNISENNVENIVEPLHGDSKQISPKEIADRVVMGYFHETSLFLETAINALKDHKGIIHYHDTFPDKKIPESPLDQIQTICNPFDRVAYLLSYQKIKSYAPGISHYVFDIEIKEREN
ncbi:MAG: class I SAM-dependent methyltransferase family protein [Thermoplasmata archaeon]|nr:MAG: class I SAM-dependent methyltransferase family protein [Thermoplasmata archaeon]